MKFVELKVSELDSFINSNEYKTFCSIPITSLRAFSQARNPSAEPNDIALIFVKNEVGNILGYIGILPAKAYSRDIRKIYFLSGWWADPVKGRGVALKLFSRFLELTGNKVCFFNLPEKMYSMLKMMNGFSFPEPIPGIKGFIRFNTNKWIPGRYPALRILKPILFLSDALLNVFVDVHSMFRKIQFRESGNFYAEIISGLSRTELNFISDITREYTHFREMDELNWAISNPWMSKNKPAIKAEANKYHFSLFAKEWKQIWFRISDGCEIKGLVYMTIRDGNASFPYAWLKMEDTDEYAKSIIIHLISLKVKSVQVYFPLLRDSFANLKSIFLYKRNILRRIAWTDEMDELMKSPYLLQDGDGDSVFT